MIARAAVNSKFALVSGEFVKIYRRALNERPYVIFGKVCNKQEPGEFHTPSKGNDRSSAPKGCNSTDAVRDALSAGTARQTEI